MEAYEHKQDKSTYEWIKYKVAAEIGGPQEQEAFKLYEKMKLDELGELRYMTIKQEAEHKYFLR